MEALLAAHPGGAGEKDAAGKLPVRLALERKVAEDVVGALLEAAEELYRAKAPLMPPTPARAA